MDLNTDQFLSGVFILLGVWLGAYITNRSNRKNERRLAKAKLVEAISLFFSLKKEIFYSINAGSIAIAEYNNLKIHDSQIANVEKEIRDAINVIEHNRRLDEKYKQALMETRAKINGLVVEVESLFGTEKGNAVLEMISKYLTSNTPDPIQYYDWKKLPYEEFQKKRIEFQSLHNAKKIEITASCDELTKFIRKVLI